LIVDPYTGKMEKKRINVNCRKEDNNHAPDFYLLVFILLSPLCDRRKFGVG
jgi:hypothetical protein